MHMVPHGCPANVHADNHFLIKVQVGFDDHNAATPLLIYDRERSFQRVLHAREPAYRVLKSAVQCNTQHHGGMKLYFTAKREADVFRVNVASLPPQQQPW